MIEDAKEPMKVSPARPTSFPRASKQELFYTYLSLQEIKSVDSGSLQSHEINVSKNVPLKGFTRPCRFLSLSQSLRYPYSAERITHALAECKSTKSWFRVGLRLRGVSSRAAIERWTLEELSRKVIGRKKEILGTVSSIAFLLR